MDTTWSASEDWPELSRRYIKMRVPKMRATAVRWEAQVEKVLAWPQAEQTCMMATMTNR